MDKNLLTNETSLANESYKESENITRLSDLQPSFFFDLFLPGILLNVIGSLGLLGNLFSIFILSRPQMKSSTNLILIGLASYDLILIITSILMFGLPSVYYYTQTYLSFYYWNIFPYITPIVYPIGLIAQTSSAYLTLCVTIERYVAVCEPLKARALCTYGRARACIFIVGVCSLCYNIPRFFEVTFSTIQDKETGVNRTEVTPTWLRQNPTYISVYITWMYVVVMYIVPFASLAALNLCIYLQIRRANAERAQLSRLQQREIRLATMLMIVVLAFFLCNVLALIINVLEALSIAISELTQISNFLVTLNSSINFIIYCIFGEKFKRLFCQLLCRQCQNGNSTTNHNGVRHFGATMTNGGVTTGHDQSEAFQLLHRYPTTSVTVTPSRRSNTTAQTRTPGKHCRFEGVSEPVQESPPEWNNRLSVQCSYDCASVSATSPKSVSGGSVSSKSGNTETQLSSLNKTKDNDAQTDKWENMIEVDKIIQVAVDEDHSHLKSKKPKKRAKLASIFSAMKRSDV